MGHAHLVFRAQFFNLVTGGVGIKVARTAIRRPRHVTAVIPRP